MSPRTPLPPPGGAPRGLGRRGAVLADALLVLAVLSVLAASLLPTLRDRAFERRVESVAAEVERRVAAATEVLDGTGTWPPTGSLDGELSDGPDSGDASSGTREPGVPDLRWRRLESVDLPPPSAPVPETGAEPLDELGANVPDLEPTFHHRGLLSLASDDDALLGALLDRYPGSFVHEDRWTLVLPRTEAPPTP